MGQSVSSGMRLNWTESLLLLIQLWGALGQHDYTTTWYRTTTTTTARYPTTTGYWTTTTTRYPTTPTGYWTTRYPTTTTDYWTTRYPTSSPVDWTTTTTRYPTTTTGYWTTSSNPPKDCPTGWINSMEGCFLFHHTKEMTWREAQEECEKLGGFLAEPKHQEQAALLASLAFVEEDLVGPHSWWIGLTDQ